MRKELVMANIIEKYFSKLLGKPGYIDPVVLRDGERVKKVAQAVHVIHAHPENDALNLELKWYEKPAGEPWPELLEPNSFHLNEEEIKKLYDYLSTSYASIGIRESGRYAIIPLDQDIQTIPQKQQAQMAKLIQALLRSKGTETLDELSKGLAEEPDLIQKLRNYAQLQKFKLGLSQLEKMLEMTCSEQEYKDWFKRNLWVFGTEYISHEKIERITIRQNIDLCYTSVDGYQDVIELKLPQAALLREDSSHPGNYYPSDDLSKAIGQCSNYLHEIAEQRSAIERTFDLPFIKPRARIIIGRSNQWERQQNDALRRINSAFNDIDIMTYDHILVRARRMIEYYNKGGK